MITLYNYGYMYTVLEVHMLESDDTYQLEKEIWTLGQQLLQSAQKEEVQKIAKQPEIHLIPISATIQ